MKPLSQSEEILTNNIYGRMLRVGRMTGWVVGTKWIWDNGWEEFIQSGRFEVLEFDQGEDLNYEALGRPYSMILVDHPSEDHLLGKNYRFALQARWGDGSAALIRFDPDNCPLDLMPSTTTASTVDMILESHLQGTDWEGQVKITRDGNLFALNTHEGTRYFKARGQALFVALTDYGIDPDMFSPMELDVAID